MTLISLKMDIDMLRVGGTTQRLLTMQRSLMNGFMPMSRLMKNLGS